MTLTVEQGRWLLARAPAPRPLSPYRASPGFDYDRIRLIALAAVVAILFVMSL